MQDYIYSVIGLIAIVIQLTVNFNTMFRPPVLLEESKALSTLWYRRLLLAIFVYYITDALWGILAGLEMTSLLRIDTTVYFMAMLLIIVCVNHYVVAYLDIQGRFAAVFKMASIVLLVLEGICLILNFFVPCFFWFDGEGNYIAGFCRYAVLWIQITMFTVSSIVTGITAFRSEGAKRKRYIAIFIFSLIMLVAIYFQQLYALWPLYALGCLLGTCVLNVYVVEDERAEYRELLIREKEKAVAASLAKTSFLSRMSHDIRTPLNGIIGLLEISERHPDDLQLQAENRAKQKVAANHLLSLINDVLQMSKLEDGKIVLAREAVDLREQFDTIRTIIELRGNEMGIRMDFSDSREVFDVPYVYTSPLHFRQLLMNIYSNALKYNKPNGSVSTTVSRVESDGEAAVYRFVISDTGIGMKPAFLEHLFEPFSQEHIDARSVYNGTGLGMSIVKGLIDSMNGTVSVDSKEGEGTTFTITLPFEPATRDEVVKPDDGADVDLSKLHILLAEDNELNAEIATELLKDAGATVEVAENGQAAVDLLAARPAGTFDLILMDVMMPVMNGYEATRVIRKLNDTAKAFIPIVAMTANAFEEDKQNALNSGMNGFIPKPISVLELLSTLNEVLRK